jgi:hypothetical protein
MCCVAQCKSIATSLEINYHVRSDKHFINSDETGNLVKHHVFLKCVGANPILLTEVLSILGPFTFFL